MSGAMHAGRSSSAHPLRHARAALTLGLWAAINQCGFVASVTSDMSCPTETVFCLADEECAKCVDALQAFASSTDNPASDFDECDELYLNVCTFVGEDASCDSSNEFLLDLARCVAADSFDCDTFTTCADVLNAATAMPALGDTRAPSPTEATTAPVVAAATPVPSLITTPPPPTSLPTVSPTSVPTASTSVAPTASGTMPPIAGASAPPTPTPIATARGLETTAPVETDDVAGAEGENEISGAARVAVASAFVVGTTAVAGALTAGAASVFAV